MSYEREYHDDRGFPPLRDPHSIPAGPVLVVAPHPDDEIIGCGGLMAFHRERGDPVVVVHVTGGEGGDPEAREEGELVAVRREESRRALTVLDVDQLVTLGLPDGGVRPEAPARDRLQQEIDKHAPAVVYAPSPFECHPDHRATSWLTGWALRESPIQARLHLYEVNHPVLTSWIVDVTPWVEKLREALTQFKSQLRYQDIVGKCLGAAYSRTVNIALPGVDYAEGYLEITPEDLPAFWDGLQELERSARCSR